MEDGCNGCNANGQCGGCGGCSGCGRGELILCKEEARILMELGQYAFLPIIQSVQGEQLHYEATPEYQAVMTDQVSDLVSSLERKQLVRVDADIPLQNADYGPSVTKKEVRCGSMALTVQGQEVLDWLPPLDHFTAL